ncbi:MAG: GFA family protein [Caulobacteraceae bacterium]
MTEPVYTGGCQCGAVRYRAVGEPKRASICHCRMCQKAIGAPFGAFVTFPTDSVAWTRGAPKRFLSSAHVARGFCDNCGTPLTFEAAAGGSTMSVTHCSLDEPSVVAPIRQLGRESRLAWLDGIDRLRGRTAEEEADMAARYPPVVSRQHPDHDTDAWPPAR